MRRNEIFVVYSEWRKVLSRRSRMVVVGNWGLEKPHEPVCGRNQGFVGRLNWCYVAGSKLVLMSFLIYSRNDALILFLSTQNDFNPSRGRNI